MLEARVDLWKAEADLRVVTTNGFVKRNGEAVMGAGCARELRDAVPSAPQKLGRLIRLHGNRPVRFLAVNGAHVASLPVKVHWKLAADLDLIEASVRSLVLMADRFGYTNVVLPHPGCGNGRLKWADVKGRIAPLLDDRFTVVTK